MKLLIVSDIPDKKYWDFYQPGDLDKFDLILSAGDLPPQYLSFLVTLARCPVFYVHGNHDDCYRDTPPEGCVCIDGKIVEFNGIRILGLGGSARYKQGVNQYTEKEMSKRIHGMRRKITRMGGFDILITHSPAVGLGDGSDHVHRGFECFKNLLDEYRPRYHFFGHQHMNYGRPRARELQYGDTLLINVTKSYEIEV